MSILALLRHEHTTNRRRQLKPAAGSSLRSIRLLAAQAGHALLRHGRLLRRGALIIWLACCLSLVAARTTRAQTADYVQFAGKSIASVSVKSTASQLAEPQEQLLDVIDIHTGETFSLPKIRVALRKLYRSGRASWVTVTAAQSTAGVELTFTFTPQAKVAAIAFAGTPVFPSDVLLSRLTSLDRGARITDRTVATSIHELSDFYRENGYFRAQVEPAVELDPTGTRGVVNFNVNPSDPTVISEFQIEISSRSISAIELLAQLAGKPGEVFSRAQLQSDVDRIKSFLRERGYHDPHFKEPVVRYDGQDNQVAIALSGEAGPVVQVTVTGFVLSKRTARELLPVLGEGGLDDFVLEEGRRKLYDHVQLQGYFFADVEYEVTRPDAEHATVEYRVERKQRYRVSEIRLDGTSHLQLDEIRDQLRSSTGSAFRRGLTSRDFLQRDSQLIARTLADRGFRRATVKERRLGFRTGTEDLVISFVVEEASVTRIAAVEIAGNAYFQASELQPLIVAKPADPFSQHALNQGSERISAKYGNAGFVFAKTEVETRETEPGQVVVRYIISEGPRVIINRAVILRNRITRRSAISRYLSFREGELLKLEDINRSEQELYSTGAFKEVKISTEAVGSAPFSTTEKHDVNVNLEEARSRQLAYGFGYQSDDGPRGLFEISSINWMGTLTTLSFKTRDSRREQLAQLSWLNPRTAGFRMPLLLSVLYQRQTEVSFNNNRLSAIAQLEKRFGADKLLFLRYDYQKVDIFNVRSARDLFFNSENVKLGRMSATMIHDTRNNAFDASSGRFSSADISLTARWLLGNAQYFRFFGEHQQYFKIPKVRGVTYAADARIGLAVPYGAAKTLPISERFFAGGATTLRGFAFQQAGPRDVLTIPVTGQVIIDPKTGLPKTGPVGGNALIVINNELRFPLAGSLGGVIFSDTGNVFNRVGAVRLDGISQSAGFGLRVRTPLGPIRVDFGYLLTATPPGYGRARLHFSFGQAF